MRIEEHPVLDCLAGRRKLKITVNGRRCEAREGDTIAAALWALGIKQFRKTRIRHEPRGPFCFNGRCTDCEVTVDGRTRVRSCMTAVSEGMIIEVPEEEA